VAVIGLGSGDTAWAAGARAETERVVVFELSSVQKPLLERAALLPGVPALKRFVSDPRVQVITADGRNALAHGGRLFDVIEADALRPGSAFAGNLYSREFFELTASRLKPGGIVCQWSPTPRTYATFRSVFPHVIEVAHRGILLGSNEPLRFDPHAWTHRLRSEHVQRYLGPEVALLLERTLATVRPGMANFEIGDLRLNEDLYPLDEFRVPLPF
jgi:spermidine synthase